MTRSIVRDGDHVIVTIPVDDVQSLRVALQPCPCRATKSNSTAAIRERFVKGLGMALFKKGRSDASKPEAR